MRKATPDWTAIETAFRDGRASVRTIAKRFSVAESTVRWKAKDAGWERTAQPRSEGNHLNFKANEDRLKPEPISGLGRELAERMLSELDATTTKQGELHDLIEAVYDDGKQRQALRQAIGLKSRAEILKTLALATKTFAEAAAPQGKKAEKQDRANKVGADGVFAPPVAPRLVVDNER